MSAKSGTAKAGSIVRDDGDRRAHPAQNFAGGLVDQVELASVSTQIV